MESELGRDGIDGGSQRPTSAQARAALGSLDRDSAALAARVVTPWWYHPALGVITATLAGAQALPGAGPTFAVAIAVIAIPVLTMAYSRRYGVAVSKPAGPRSKRLLLTMLAVVLATMGSSVLIKLWEQEPWWVALPAIVAFVATVILGRRYDDALRQEIGDPSGARP